MAVLKESKFYRLATADPRIASFLKGVRAGTYSLDTASMLDEIERMHMGRKLRVLTTQQVLARSQHELIDTNLQNQAYRSRCVEIKMRATRKINLLWERSEAARRYINIQWRSLLQQEFRTAGERKEAVEAVLSAVTNVTNQLEQVTTMADLVIDDLDTSGWAITRVINILNLSTRPERNI